MKKALLVDRDSIETVMTEVVLQHLGVEVQRAKVHAVAIIKSPTPESESELRILGFDDFIDRPVMVHTMQKVIERMAALPHRDQSNYGLPESLARHKPS